MRNPATGRRPRCPEPSGSMRRSQDLKHVSPKIAAPVRGFSIFGSWCMPIFTERTCIIMTDHENIQQESAKTYRIPRQRLSLVRDGSLPSTWKHFRGSHDVFSFAQEQLYSDADREQFHILMLDNRNRLIGLNLVSQGSLSTTVVCPREVFKAAIIVNTAAVILLHNHPSGCPEPSQEDLSLTRRLCEAGKILGIKVLDHVVIGQEAFYSFADNGRLVV